ncbi:hypothetical protein M9980_00935 [Sphingomonas donggukensis]|uniref:Uncharacterized protein n=1 Tax=Sphingomonas donggukensis TaxID=2949093 RepID=A0ABY4TU77_9SPHN|nr:hypothetical protein [Sphingomonas donggukensis]URW75832.1 hypothetical protein M9980_00935 [Sphingomonas donggukensis]
MADTKVRTHRLTESLLHCGVAMAAVVIVYLLGGVVGDGAVAAARYFTG